MPKAAMKVANEKTESQNGTDTLDMHIGQRLRLQRTLAGLSQKNIGQAIGVTFQQIQKYERGANRVSAALLYQFAKLFGVPVSYFFEHFDSPNLGQFATATTQLLGVAENKNNFEHELAGEASSREALEILRAFNKVSDQNMRKRLLELVRAVANNQAVL